jgi:hypothetical protein
MILTGSNRFWCPRHGEQPLSVAESRLYDDAGGGPYIPFYKVLCKGCGEEGMYVDTEHEGHPVQDGNCLYCLQSTDRRNPFPFGIGETRKRLLDLNLTRGRAERAQGRAEGLWDGGEFGEADLSEKK